eukprot:2523863-Rhodomonas_salina.1
MLCFARCCRDAGLACGALCRACPTTALPLCAREPWLALSLTAAWPAVRQATCARRQPCVLALALALPLRSLAHSPSSTTPPLPPRFAPPLLSRPELTLSSAPAPTLTPRSPARARSVCHRQLAVPTAFNRRPHALSKLRGSADPLSPPAA